MGLTVLIMAAGSGSRMNINKTKQRIILGGKSILRRTVEIFDKCDAVDSITVAGLRWTRGWGGAGSPGLGGADTIHVSSPGPREATHPARPASTQGLRSCPPGGLVSGQPGWAQSVRGVRAEGKEGKESAGVGERTGPRGCAEPRSVPREPHHVGRNSLWPEPSNEVLPRGGRGL